MHFLGNIRCLLFLSTLSLRRATGKAPKSQAGKHISIHALLAESDRIRARVVLHEKHFYPRSPCGERPARPRPGAAHAGISIHALLAESDEICNGGNRNITISIHALLAESDA